MQPLWVFLSKVRRHSGMLACAVAAQESSLQRTMPAGFLPRHAAQLPWSRWVNGRVGGGTHWKTSERLLEPERGNVRARARARAGCPKLLTRLQRRGGLWGLWPLQFLCRSSSGVCGVCHPEHPVPLLQGPLALLKSLKHQCPRSSTENLKQPHARVLIAIFENYRMARLLSSFCRCAKRAEHSAWLRRGNIKGTREERVGARYKLMLLDRLLVCVASSSLRPVSGASIRSSDNGGTAVKFREALGNPEEALVQLWNPLLDV